MAPVSLGVRRVLKVEAPTLANDERRGAAAPFRPRSRPSERLLLLFRSIGERPCPSRHNGARAQVPDNLPHLLRREHDVIGFTARASLGDGVIGHQPLPGVRTIERDRIARLDARRLQEPLAKAFDFASSSSKVKRGRRSRGQSLHRTYALRTVEPRPASRPWPLLPDRLRSPTRCLQRMVGEATLELQPQSARNFRNWHAFPCRRSGRARQLCPGTSDVDFLGDIKRVVDLDAEVSNRAFDLGVAEEQLNRPQVARAPVDQGRLRPPHGMRGVLARVEADAADPLAHETSILASRSMLTDRTRAWSKPREKSGLPPSLQI